MASTEIRGPAFTTSDGQVPSVTSRGVGPWLRLALAAILVLYVFNVLRAQPISIFGVDSDDGLYFSSAKAIATGQGYVLPGFPGHLPSMKYPELYPLLLAGVWKVDSKFPGNVALGAGLSVVFGCFALLVTFFLLRRWPALGDWPALSVVFLVSLYSEFIYRSTMLASDIPFMAFLLGAAWFAERSLARETGAREAAGAGTLAGMSVGLRALGVPVAAGIGLLLLAKRQLRRLFWFCLTALPLTLFWAWPTIRALVGSSKSAVQPDSVGSGWTQTVCFYSSYACEWRLHSPTLATIWSTFVLNLRLLIQWPGQQLLGPFSSFAGFRVLPLMLVILVSTTSYAGLARHVHSHGWRPLHAVFLLSLPVIVSYPFNPRRYLLPFAPLLFAGLWLEGRRIATLAREHLKQGSGWDERLVAGLLALGGLALAAVIALNFCYASPRFVRSLGLEREAILTEERGAFEWIREHAPPDARIIAYEDGLTYLYTGRPSIRSIFCVSEGYYLTDPRYLRRDALRLGDVARHIGASYWLTSPYDFPIETKSDRAKLLKEEGKLLSDAPIVYRDPSGNVTLYDVRCLFDSAETGCAGR